MQNNFEDMKAKIAMLNDPESGYTQEAFNNEFNMGSTDTIEYYKMEVNFVNKSTNQDPEYATAGSSGFDLRANLPSSIIVLEVGKRILVPTGLYFEIPESLEMQVRSRSGLAYKNGVVVLNGVGTIDADYRGEIGVLLINHGDVPFTINHGDRIAQGVIAPVVAKNIANLIKKDELSTTDRSSGGFGSTGVK